MFADTWRVYIRRRSWRKDYVHIGNSVRTPRPLSGDDIKYTNKTAQKVSEQMTTWFIDVHRVAEIEYKSEHMKGWKSKLTCVGNQTKFFV